MILVTVVSRFTCERGADGYQVCHFQVSLRPLNSCWRCPGHLLTTGLLISLLSISVRLTVYCCVPFKSWSRVHEITWSW